jgi:predicted dinucleotide-binding enzyme
MAQTIDCGALPDSVSILGATGALGFGLAVRLGRAGTPVVIGSRDEGRAQEAAERARAAVPDGSFEGLQNAQAARRARGCAPRRSSA